MRNGDARFESARRVVRILDLVGRRGVLSVKALARELGVSLSACNRLVSILVEEGIFTGVGARGYGPGPAVAALRVRKPGGDFLEAELEPVIGKLAQRSGRHAYLGLLSDGAVTVSRV